MTTEAYESLAQYMKKMNGKIYYAALPVTKRNAGENVWIMPDGKREAICL